MWCFPYFLHILEPKQSNSAQHHCKSTYNYAMTVSHLIQANLQIKLAFSITFFFNERERSNFLTIILCP